MVTDDGQDRYELPILKMLAQPFAQSEISDWAISFNEPCPFGF